MKKLLLIKKMKTNSTNSNELRRKKLFSKKRMKTKKGKKGKVGTSEKNILSQKKRGKKTKEVDSVLGHEMEQQNSGGKSNSSKKLSNKLNQKNEESLKKNLLLNDKDFLLTRKNTLGIKIPERSIFFHKIFKNFPKENSIVNKFTECLYIILLNRLIFSGYFLEVIGNELGNGSKQYVAFLSTRSIIGRLTQFIDPLVLVGHTRPVIVLALVLAYVMFAVLLNLFFWKYDWFKKLIPNSRFDRVMNWVPVKAIAFVLGFYELIFFNLNLIFFHAFYCRETPIRTETGEIIINPVTSEPQGTISVSYLSRNISCMSARHKIMITLSVVIILLNFSLIFITWRVTKFLPKIRIRQGNRGIYDLAYSLLINSLVIYKAIIKTQRLGFSSIMNYYLVCFIIHCILYLWAYKSKPYYNIAYRRYKAGKIIYVWLLSGVCLGTSLINQSAFQEEKSCIIMLLILITILIKLDWNFNRVRIQTIYHNLKSSSGMTSKAILSTYYKLTRYISEKIKEADGEVVTSKELQDTQLLIIKLRNNHKIGCSAVHCFCKRDKLFNKIHSLTLSQKFRNQKNFLLEAIMVLDILFRRYFKLNPEPDTDIFYCYLDFLVNYFGKPALAYHLVLRRKLNMMRSRRINMELGVLLIELNELIVENLSKGDLALRVHSSYFSNEDKLLQEDERKIRLIDHILYLQKFEEMKKKIREVVEVKASYLAEVSKVNSMLPKICQASTQFYYGKEAVKRIFASLKELSGNNFSPVYCVYGHFMKDVCEDAKEGNSALRRYDRIVRNCNLNKVFMVKKVADTECVILRVESHPKRQRFIDITSNVKRWLGKN